MPKTHRYPLRVRASECDAYGHVNHVSYLRWMQEAAFEASAAAGYPGSRYSELGQYWLVHDSQVEYHSALVYGDAATVETWVLDFGRVRSRRAYRVTRDADGALAARGLTDWAYIDDATGRPARIPAELIAGFQPDEASESAAPPREAFPTQPPVAPRPYVMTMPVEWRDIDEMQHLNNAAALHYLEEAGVRAPGAFGWPMQRCAEELNLGFFLHSMRIEYAGQPQHGDSLRVMTWLSDVKGASFYRHFRAERESDGDLMLRARSRYAFVDLTSGRPRRPPVEFLTDFAEHLSPAE